MSANLEVFERGIRRERKATRILILVFAVIPIGGLIWALTDGEVSRQMARMGAMSGLGVLIASVIMIGTFFRHKALTALKKPEDIIWFCAWGAEGAEGSLRIGLRNGRFLEVPLAGTKDVPEALEILVGLAPHAMQGYSREAHGMFQHNPKAIAEMGADGATAQELAEVILAARAVGADGVTAQDLAEAIKAGRAVGSKSPATEDDTSDQSDSVNTGA
jgi:hypothetical protein